MATKNKKKIKTQNSVSTASRKGPYPKGEVPAPLKKHVWPKGFCPNPAGRPKDVAGVLARLVFEGMSDQDLEATVKGMRGKLKAGDARLFAALAERGYMKLPQQTNLGNGPEGKPFTDKPPVVNVHFKGSEPKDSEPQENK